MFSLSDTGNADIRFWLGPIRCYVHFFEPDSITIYVEAKDIDGQASLDELLAFMKRLGSQLDCAIDLTVDGCPHMPYIKYRRESDTFSVVKYQREP